MRASTVLSECSALPSLTCDIPEDADAYYIGNETMFNVVQLYHKLTHEDEFIANNIDKFERFINPFKTIKSCFRSPLTSSSVVVNNGFFKTYELLEAFDAYIPKTGNVKFMNIGCNSGMNTLAAEYYLCQSEHKRPITFDWYATANTDLKDEINIDTYGIYRTNPSRFIPCDMLNESNVKALCASKEGVFDVVYCSSSLVNAPYCKQHHSVYRFDEGIYVDIAWSHMYTALRLTRKGGMAILFAFTHVTSDTHLLCDVLTQYFKQVVICKPYTSNIASQESYIVCLERNTKPATDIPFIRPFVHNYTSPNAERLYNFDGQLMDEKISITMCVASKLKESLYTNFNQMQAHPLYNDWYMQFKRLNDLFYYMGRNNTSRHNFKTPRLLGTRRQPVPPSSIGF